MIITIHLIMLFLPYIFHIINFYFEFINPSWPLNRKRRPRQKLLKRYIKRFYRQKIKIRRFSPTNNQLLENTYEATHPMASYLAPNKNWRKRKFDTDSFEIYSGSGASSCATPDEIDFIPGTYKHLTGVTINGIAEGLKVSGCGSVSWIFQYDNKDNIELIME